jgi:hypothetical protein
MQEEGDAMEADDYDRALEAKIDRDALRRMSMKELADFASVLRTASDIVGAFSCEPRFQRNARSYGQNAAGGLLAEIEGFLQGYADAAIEVAKETKLDTLDDAEHRSLMLLEDAVRRHVDTPEIVRLAANAVADEADVRNDEDMERLKEAARATA